jgi:hypothetical protein
MIRKLVHISGAVLTAVLLFAATGSAQTFDVSGGYAYRNESGGEGQDRVAIKNGWYGAAGFNLSDSFGVFGQLSQHKTSIDVPIGGGQIVPVDVTLRLYGGGPRISGNQRAPVTYFVQALFGGAQLKTKVGGRTVRPPKAGSRFNPRSASTSRRVVRSACGSSSRRPTSSRTATKTRGLTISWSASSFAAARAVLVSV